MRHQYYPLQLIQNDEPCTTSMATPFLLKPSTQHLRHYLAEAKPTSLSLSRTGFEPRSSLYFFNSKFFCAPFSTSSMPIAVTEAGLHNAMPQVFRVDVLCFLVFFVCSESYFLQYSSEKSQSWQECRQVSPHHMKTF